MRKALLRWRAVFGSGILIMLTVTVLGSSAQAQSSGPILNPANEHFYEAVTVSGGIGWFDARDAAELQSFWGVQGHLVTITSAQEDNFIIANFPEAFEPQPDPAPECAGGPTPEPSNCGDPYWLGGFQPTGSPPGDPAGGWEWVTGEPFVYAPWAVSEPNDFNGRDEDCLHPHPNQTPKWNDSQCDDRRVGGYVVEYDISIPGGIINIYLPIVSRGFTGEIDPINRTVTSTAFFVDWHDTNPEEIVNIQWNGSSNLTNAWPHPNCPAGGDLEFFGNSWGTEGGGNFVSPVGWGTTGTWQGQDSVTIDSSASGCFGTSGIPVQTRYFFWDSGPSVNRIRVERRFEFGSTPFTYDFSPYIPRLFPRDEFTQVIHPDAAGTSLVTELSANCEVGCMVTNWDGSWFAIHAPSSGRGLIVRHDPSPYSVALQVEQDGGSFTNRSSVLLLQPGGGFTGDVVDVQYLCFYDSSLWTPSLTLPPGC